jgi:hypothetical protein
MSNPIDEQLRSALSGKIDAAIAEGIRQAQAKQSRRRKYIRRRMGNAAAVCILLLICLFTIRVSPVFASIVRDIPGFERFVDLIRHNADQGIKLAVDNDFVQPVNVFDEHDGVRFTVQGIIVDESRMVMFYEVELPGKDEHVQLDHPRLSDGLGNPLPAGISFSYPEEAKQDIRTSGIQRGTADFSLAQDVVLPDEVVLRLSLKRSALSDPSEPPKAARIGEEDVAPATSEGTEFRVQIPIDRAKFAGLREEYAINRTIQVEGQEITFSKAVVSPLQVSLYLDYSEKNAKQIFGAGDIRLIDDQGRVWKNTSASMAKDHPIYRFESPYFVRPSSLRVEGSWFRALDKQRMTVTVNTETKQVIDAPDGKLALHQVARSDEYTKLDFSISGLDAGDNMMYSMFEDEFVDAAGYKYHASDLREVISGYSNGSEPDVQHDLFYIDNVEYEQPLTFKIYNYPDYIRQSYEVRIK